MSKQVKEIKRESITVVAPEVILIDLRDKSYPLGCFDYDNKTFSPEITFEEFDSMSNDDKIDIIINYVEEVVEPDQWDETP